MRRIFRSPKLSMILWLVCVAITAQLRSGMAAIVTISTFPTRSTLEDVVPVPDGFGSLGGQIFVNSATTPGIIYSIPGSGGPPTVFATVNPLFPDGGAFLPSNYGALSGEYLAAGSTASATKISDVIALSPTGSQTAIALNVAGVEFRDVAIAPAGFDGVGGQVLLANEGLGTAGSIYTLNPSLKLSVVPGGDSFPRGAQPFGLAFAPAGFGSIGGDLLISDASSGEIYSFDPAGTLHLFATVPLGPGQVGLRQIAFAPLAFADHGINYGGDLLVSVSGSTNGGGIAGSVDVLDASGGTIAYLRQGTVGAPYDPRGIYFPGGPDVFIADTDPSVFSASASDFTAGSPAVPEPGSLLLLGSAVTCFILFAVRPIRGGDLL